MTNSPEETREYSSFRDPSGSVFVKNGAVYRRVNLGYRPHYNALMDSGLYQKLVEDHLLVPHKLAEEPGPDGSIVIQPEQIPFISYPYEWCFEQYQDAALAMLHIEAQALEFGMTLKDASGYNIQFLNGKPLLIDTLSFETYLGGPWAGYGQFCRHFLGPLFLAAYLDSRLTKMMQNYIDGIPLDLGSLLLRGKGGFGVLQHIHWHAKFQAKYASAGGSGHLPRLKPLTKQTLSALIESLIRIVQGLSPKKTVTEWGAYYQGTNYSEAGADEKARIVKAFASLALKGEVSPLVWDLGANDGRYSRIAAEQGGYVVAFDIDMTAVGHCYRNLKQHPGGMLPLLLDLTAPSPGIGFANRERKTISDRGKPRLTLALALIHHLVIAHNIPFGLIAEWFASFTKDLIIEFVPKGDSQTERLLRTRPDIFTDYTEPEFERAFCGPFGLLEKGPIPESQRTMYLFRRR
ncbi:MAG: hypothetical protein LBG90_07280 [Spirochaetaceae bacterium]|jgi:hypothetical protein|nr:hypothetical protein [Spirochaetaceae bacterium]